MLVSKDGESVLIDGGFTLSDGAELADRITAGGTALSTIYVTSNDPDYYFGLRPITVAFPDARVVAAPETVAAIKANVGGKIATWSTKLGSNGPADVEEAVIPEPTDESVIDLAGTSIDIVTAAGMEDSRYLWVSDIKAIFGGTLVYSGVHVWVADAASLAHRQAWITTLDEMLGRDPEVVVAGHGADGVDDGADALRFTRDYLTAFNDEDARTPDSVALIAAMTERYPDLGDVSTLELGAKVVKGEMQWG